MALVNLFELDIYEYLFSSLFLLQGFIYSFEDTDDRKLHWYHCSTDRCVRPIFRFSLILHYLSKLSFWFWNEEIVCKDCNHQKREPPTLFWIVDEKLSWFLFTSSPASWHLLSLTCIYDKVYFRPLYNYYLARHLFIFIFLFSIEYLNTSREDDTKSLFSIIRVSSVWISKKNFFK